MLSSRKLKKKKGFTLLEVMVVLIILGVLAAVVAPKMSKYIKNSKVSAVKMEIETIKSALAQYYLSNEKYPQTLYIIAKEFLEKAKISGNQVLDPWKVPYLYKAFAVGSQKRQRYTLASAGPDNIHGTLDDIKYDGGNKRITNDSDDDEDGDVFENDLFE